MIDKEKLLEDFKLAQEGSREAKDRIGFAIIEMINIVRSKERWKHYSGKYKEAMIDEATLRCVQAINNWKPDGGKHPLSWLYMKIESAFSKTTARMRGRDNKIKFVSLNQIKNRSILENYGLDTSHLD